MKIKKRDGTIEDIDTFGETSNSATLTAGAPPGTNLLPRGIGGILPPGVDSNTLMSTLYYSASDDKTDEEINALEIWKPNITSYMFGTSDYVKIHEGAKAMRVLTAKRLMDWIQYPFVGSPQHDALLEIFDATFKPKPRFQSGVQASLVADPIQWVPDYTPFMPYVMKKTPPKDFYMITSGQDSLQYETPISRGTAINFDPQSMPATRMIEITGSNATILPYFKSSPRKTLRFWEWAQRLIQLPIYMKSHVLQELAEGWDADVITLFDAAVPDGSLYSSHSTHISTISNAAGAVTWDVWNTAAAKFRHTDSASGIQHIAVPGIALTDIEAVNDIEYTWGNDMWTEAEVSEIVKMGWGENRNSEGLVTGKKISGFAVLQTPLKHSSNNRKVRFFPRPEQYGYWIPITLQGKNIFTSIAPMKGADPDFEAMQNTLEPPGFTFFVQATQIGALQVVGYFNSAKINHS